VKYLWILLLPLIGNAQLPCKQKKYSDKLWTNIGPYNQENYKTQNGAVRSMFAIDSLHILIGSMSNGLWETFNGGKNWKCITDGYAYGIYGVRFIDIDTPQNKKIVIGTGYECEFTDVPNSGIVYSEDAGQSWKASEWDNQIYSNGYYPFIAAMCGHDDKYFCAAGGKIYRSLDGAKSFQEIYDLSDEFDIKLSSIRGMTFVPEKDVLYFNTFPEGNTNKNGVYKIVNSQAFEINQASTKNPQAENLTKDLFKLLEIHQFEECQLTYLHPNLLQVNYFLNNNTYHGAWINADSKKLIKKWKINLVIENVSNKYMECMVSLNQKDHFMMSYTVQQSNDSGQNFKQHYTYSDGANQVPHADIRCSFFMKYPGHYYIGTDGGLCITRDNGKSYQSLNTHELILGEIYGIACSPISGTLITGLQDHGICKYENGKWRYEVNGDGYDCEASMIDSAKWLGTQNYGILKYSLKNELPLRHAYYLSEQRKVNNVRTIKSMPSGNFYFAGTDLYRIDTFNKAKKIEGFKIDNYIGGFDIAPSNENVQIVSNFYPNVSSGVYKTIDGGLNWENITEKVRVNIPRPWEIIHSKINEILIHPYNEDEIWIALGYFSSYTDLCDGSNRIWHSIDGGDTWSDMSNGLASISINDLVYLPGSDGVLFAASNHGVYIYENNMWNPYGKGLPMSMVNEIKVDYKNWKLLAATMGRGIWEIPLIDSFPRSQFILRKGLISIKGIQERDIVLKKKARVKLDPNIIWIRNASLKAKKSQIIE
jgi:photosystem II stability/assembly factor-like uncharacterized protein